MAVNAFVSPFGGQSLHMNLGLASLQLTDRQLSQIGMTVATTLHILYFFFIVYYFYYLHQHVVSLRLLLTVNNSTKQKLLNRYICHSGISAANLNSGIVKSGFALFFFSLKP